MRGLPAAALLAALAAGASADEVRSFKPIERPGPPGFRTSEAPRVRAQLAVRAERVEDAMRHVVRAWNDRELDGILAADFRDRSALLDAMETRVPVDARLRVVAIQDWRIVDQAVQEGTLLTRLAVTARTALDFTDAGGARRTREGVNEYLVLLRDSGR